MLHHCKTCSSIYLASEFYDLCNWCGEAAQRQIERLYEDDGAVEWWMLVAQAGGFQRPERIYGWTIA
jgi:hypothetical protein